MNRLFPHLVTTLLIFVCSCLIYGQSNDSQKQPVNTNSDTGYSESRPYAPRVFEHKSKKQKNKKNTQGPAQTVQPETEKLSADTVITLPVSVFDSRGGFITGLQKSDFKVFANDAECNIVTVTTKDQPLNIVLLIDTSPSAYLQIEDLKNYAHAIADQLRPRDKVIIAQFNEKMKIMAELTDNRRTLDDAIDKIQQGDGTSLYDAIQEIFSERLNQLTGRTALIILTDGVDTTSKSSSYEQSLVEAEESKATVFPIYFDTLTNGPILPRGAPLNMPAVILGAGLRSAQAEYDLGKLYLNDLTNLSGGRAIKARKPAKGQRAEPSKIITELSLQYYVSFRLPEAPNKGERKQIKLRVDRPNLAVLTRGSYIAGK